MTSSTSGSRHARLVLAEMASGVTLLLSSLYTLGFYDSSLALNVRGLTIIAIVLAAGGFVLALRLRAPLVAALLTVAGVVIWIPPVGAIVAAGAIAVPGPILGVIFFAPIFALGAVKTVTTYRSYRNSRALEARLFSAKHESSGPAPSPRSP